MAEVTYISYSARAKSTTADGIFAEAHQILDVSKNKNQQAINAEVTTELGKKVAKSDFDSFKTSNTSAIAAKADKSYVDTELGKKATKSEVSAVDAKFAGVFCNVDEVINNGGEVCVTIDTVDKKKVDIDLPVYHKSVVDTKLGTKANSADVYTKTQVYTKGETDTKLGTKANSADVYTKAQADSAITAKVNAAVASVYRVKGTKATIAEVTALTNVKSGDVWNVTAEFTLGGKKYPAGTNVVALADKSAADAANWDALGGTVDLAGHTAEMKSWANGQFAGKAFEAKVNTNTSNISSLTTRVGAVETKATTNASNISSLTTRVTAAEGKFAGYYTKGETDTKLGTKANSADVYTKDEVDGKVRAAKMQEILVANLDKETILTLKSDPSRACMQVVDSNLKPVGVLFQFSDDAGHVLTQEFHTHYTYNADRTFDGSTAGLIVKHNHNAITVFSRHYSDASPVMLEPSVHTPAKYLSQPDTLIGSYFTLLKYKSTGMPKGNSFPLKSWTPWRSLADEDSMFLDGRLKELEDLLKLA
jgi:hypothetical protein